MVQEAAKIGEKTERFEIKIDERSTSPKTMVSLGGKKVGLVQKIVIECDANEVLETMRVHQLGSDVPALFREAGVSVKDFEAVVRERDEALAELKKFNATEIIGEK